LELIETMEVFGTKPQQRLSDDKKNEREDEDVPLEWISVLHRPSKRVAITIIHKRLNAVPSAIQNFTSLSKLNLGHNHLTHLPDEIGTLKSLVSLHLGNNRLECLPRAMKNLHRLQRLQLFSNNLTEIHGSILSGMQSLQFLNLNGNSSVSTLPQEIGDLQLLEKLSVATCSLTEIPSEIGHCKHLKQLTLSDNFLVTLPTSMSLLANLQNVNLVSNHLAHFPPCLLRMTALAHLEISANNIQWLPIATIGLASKLTTFHFEKNDFVRPDPEGCSSSGHKLPIIPSLQDLCLLNLFKASKSAGCDWLLNLPPQIQDQCPSPQQCPVCPRMFVFDFVEAFEMIRIRTTRDVPVLVKLCSRQCLRSHRDRFFVRNTTNLNLPPSSPSTSMETMSLGVDATVLAVAHVNSSIDTNTKNINSLAGNLNDRAQSDSDSVADQRVQSSSVADQRVQSSYSSSSRNRARHWTSTPNKSAR